MAKGEQLEEVAAGRGHEEDIDPALAGVRLSRLVDGGEPPRQE